MRNLIILASLILTSCATKQIHPGAVNNFDSQAYDTLHTVQAGIEQAKKEVVAYPALKPELNKLIDGYNAAQAAYKTYHEAAVAGKPTDSASLQTLLTSITNSLAAIVAKLHPPKSPAADCNCIYIPTAGVIA